LTENETDETLRLQIKNDVLSAFQNAKTFGEDEVKQRIDMFKTMCEERKNKIMEIRAKIEAIKLLPEDEKNKIIIKQIQKLLPS